MEKLSYTQVNGILLESASTIRGLRTRNLELEAELAKRDRSDHAEKIAQVAVSRSLMAEEEAADYATKLANSDDNLDMVEEWVGRAASGLPLGQEKVASVDETPVEGGDAEVNFAAALLGSDIVG
jgi:hypothetical protein